MKRIMFSRFTFSNIWVTSHKFQKLRIDFNVGYVNNVGGSDKSPYASLLLSVKFILPTGKRQAHRLLLAGANM